MTPSAPSLLPRLLIAAGLLRALAHLRRLLSAPPHSSPSSSSASDLALHEGVEAVCAALTRLSQVAPTSADMHRALRQAEAIYLDTDSVSDADLVAWADGWEAVAAATCDAAMTPRMCRCGRTAMTPHEAGVPGCIGV